MSRIAAANVEQPQKNMLAGLVNHVACHNQESSFCTLLFNAATAGTV